ncbi:hypothetical protein NQ166_00445 [Microbacterium sp. zg.Y1090]|uniref:hypothetical protein n=1 Tax=Microbacterium wangruii TaxID=3049073 RepID=UPI00214B963C|nr:MULTISPECIES: hypothetical protein [unclassified Microbacterium]MCR2817298.1 hypothetical protein [Microbacterium sp. zg.Y1090]WIM29214.1 hypothetical protein QNO26_04765 [Microbacterium sp. zg-Y1090]
MKAEQDGPSEPSDWVRLGRVDWRFVFIVAGPLWLLAYIPVAVARLFTDVLALQLLLGLAGFLVFAVVTLLVMWVRTPGVWANVAEQKLRSGRRTVNWADLSTAELVLVSQNRHGGRTLLLVLRDAAGTRFPVMLRRREKLALTASEAAVARAVIEASSIAMPRAKEDPRGDFSRWNFPSNVSKADAVRLVSQPPTKDELLPIPQ